MDERGASQEFQQDRAEAEERRGPTIKRLLCGCCAAGCVC